LNFLGQILEKNTQDIKLHEKSVQWETEFFHADGQTGMKKLIVTFRNFTNAPKKIAPN